ncbi:MAG: hypothetical protein KME49_22820 [Brasilonema octagenarum HA4186-MV1]|jgi:hypothetical protein|nr:hypothetical protein [Brasilonema octagenarum HA4186-MV1]
MNLFIKVIVLFLSDSVLDQLQDAGLKELDRRGLKVLAEEDINTGNVKSKPLDLNQLEAFRGE